MESRVFTKDTMLDLVVNVVPLGIILFFILQFAFVGPFDWHPLYSTLAHLGMAGMFVGLVIITYISARVIERDAAKTEEAGRLAHGSDEEGIEDTSKTADQETPPGAPNVTGDVDQDRRSGPERDDDA